MDNSRANFFQNFNESSLYVAKVFSVLQFGFDENSSFFVSKVNEIFHFT